MSAEDRRRDDETSSDDAAPGDDDGGGGGGGQDLDTKPASKAIRVLTVLAYLLSVSLAAILLSVYYIFVWDPPRPPRSPQPRHPAAEPLRDNSSALRLLLQPTANEINFTNKLPTGDTAVRETVDAVITPLFTPPIEPSDNYTTAGEEQRHPGPRADLLENQTNAISKTTSKRKRARDPENS